MDFKADVDHSTFHGNFPIYSPVVKQEQTYRDRGCQRALRASPVLGIWLPRLRASLEAVQLRGAPAPLLALDTAL